MYVADLKRLLDSVPDNALVFLGDTDVTIESISYSTLDGFAKLGITEGFEIVTDKFVSNLMNDLQSALRQNAMRK